MKNIATALVKAQKNFEPARKTSNNPHFRSKYADLATCVDAVIEALNDNGIFLMQTTHNHDHGVMVNTVFLHESGEMIDAGSIFIPASKSDAQGFGSALTYARRYSLLAACGIAPEDDDGNAAVATKKPDTVSGASAQAKYDAAADKRHPQEICSEIVNKLNAIRSRTQFDGYYKGTIKPFLDAHPEFTDMITPTLKTVGNKYPKKEFTNETV